MDLAIFDLDGTLIDSMSVWKNLSSNYLKELNIVPETNLEQKVRTMSFVNAADYVKNYYELPFEVNDIIKEWFSRVQNAYANTIQEKQCTLEYLNYLKNQNVKMCIATASTQELTQKAITRLGISEFMEFTITVEELGINKDKPDIFLYCADRLQVPVNKCSVFEDSLHAIESAKTGGFHTIGLKDKENLDIWEQIVSTAHVSVNHFGELITPGATAASF